MIRFLCVLTVFLLPHSVLAKCAMGDLTAWPSPGHSLPANGLLVLEGSGTFRETVTGIGERTPHLVAGKDEVPLRVVAVHHGAFELSQAILKPERPLRPGERYTLRLTQHKDSQEPELQLLDSENVPMEWPVTKADVTPPRWREVPRVMGQSAEMLGCGDEIHVNISASVDENGPEFQVLAEVQRVDGGEPVRFRLRTNGGQVAIGQDMCSGAFLLQDGRRYTVRLVAVDLAGNEKAAPGDPVLITGPSVIESLGPPRPGPY